MRFSLQVNKSAIGRFRQSLKLPPRKEIRLVTAGSNDAMVLVYGQQGSMIPGTEADGGKINSNIVDSNNNINNSGPLDFLELDEDCEPVIDLLWKIDLRNNTPRVHTKRSSSSSITATPNKFDSNAVTISPPMHFIHDDVLINSTSVNVNLHNSGNNDIHRVDGDDTKTVIFPRGAILRTAIDEI